MWEEERTEQSSQAFSWKRAGFPAVITCCAFACFIFLYYHATVRLINPMYILALPLIIPSLIFAYITYLAGKGKWAKNIDDASIKLAIILLICSLFYIFQLALISTSQISTNITRYERTMKLGGYNTKEQLAFFPEKIPSNAENVNFYYCEMQWMDYSQTVVLRFSADGATIDAYAKEFGAYKIIDSNGSDAKYGWDYVGDDRGKYLPADYKIYYIYKGSNNKICVISISQQRKDIIFYADEFSM